MFLTEEWIGRESPMLSKSFRVRVIETGEELTFDCLEYEDLPVIGKRLSVRCRDGWFRLSTVVRHVVTSEGFYQEQGLI